MWKIKNKLKRFCKTHFFFIIIIASVRELFDPTMYVSIKLLCRHTTIEPVISVSNTSVDRAFDVLSSQTWAYGKRERRKRCRHLAPADGFLLNFPAWIPRRAARAPVKGRQMNFTPASRKSFNEISTFIIHGVVLPPDPSRRARTRAFPANRPALRTIQ